MAASGYAGDGAKVQARSAAEAADSYGDPGAEVDGAGEHFVTALANVLTHLASLAGRPQRLTRFHSIRPPSLSVYDYLTRISNYFQCSNECFVLCLVYIDRIVKLHPEFTISKFNIHRLLITSIMLAVKFYDDVYYTNSYYAKVGGVKTKEINGLEAQFLQLIDWNMYVSPQEYEQYRSHVFRAVSGQPHDAGASASSSGEGQADTDSAAAKGGGASSSQDEDSAMRDS